jgi:hypothetical protein
MTAGRGFPQSPVASSITMSPRLIAHLVIGRVEFGNRLNPTQGFSLPASNETGDLGGNASADGLQTRVGNNETQLTQATLAPSLAHHPHSFGRCRRHNGTL